MEPLIDCRPGRQVGNSMFGYLNKANQYPTHCVGCGKPLPMMRKPDAISTCDTVCIIQSPQRSKDRTLGKRFENLIVSLRNQGRLTHV